MAPSEGNLEGQRGQRQSIVARLNNKDSRMVPNRASSRKEQIEAAYNYLSRHINSLLVQRLFENQTVVDTAQTYELRTDKFHKSYLSHHLPKGVTIRVNERTTEVELFVNNRRYRPTA